MPKPRSKRQHNANPPPDAHEDYITLDLGHSSFHHVPNGRGRGRGYRGGQGRGSGRGNFRARGGDFRGRGDGRGGGRGGRGGYIPSSNTDFILQQWPQSNPGSGYNSPQRRGRGRGNNSPLPLHTYTPTTKNPGRGRGRGEFNDDRGSRGRGRGRGGQRGGWKGKERDLDAPLSRLLNEDRPLLRVINFVPAVHQRFLFIEEEEILLPVAEDIQDDEEESHVPTADRVAQVFGYTSFAHNPHESSGDEKAGAEEELEEIDFADLASYQETIDASAAKSTQRSTVEVKEEAFTGFYNKPTSSGTTEQPVAASSGVLVDSVGSDMLQSSATASGSPPTAPTIAPTTTSTHQVTSVTTVVDDMDVTPAAEEKETNGPPLPAAETRSPTGLQETETATQSTEQSDPTLLSSSVAAMDLDDAMPHETKHESSSFFIDTTPDLTHAAKSQPTGTTGEALGLPDEDIIVYVAPHPRSGRVTPDPTTHETATTTETQTPTAPVTSILTGLPIGEIPSIPEIPDVDSVSFSFSTTPGPSTSTNTHQPLQPLDSGGDGGGGGGTPKSKPPLFKFMLKKSTPAKMKMRQRNVWLKKERSRKGKGKGSSFALRGVEVSEARMWDGVGRDDSDVDWGSDDEDVGEEMVEEEEVRAEKDGKLRVVSVSKRKFKKAGYGAEGMDVDPELETDIAAMKVFAEGINREFVTMDDLEDEKRMREEDRNGHGGGVGSSGESDSEDEEDEDPDEDAVMELEERILIGEKGEAEDGEEDKVEDEDDEEAWDDDDDDDEEHHSPKTSFQARLDKLRKQAQGRSTDDKGKARATDQDFYEDLEDSDDDIYVGGKTWAEDDEDFIGEIEDILAENEDILTGRDRKARKELFRAIRDGNFDDNEEFMPRSRKRKDKGKDLPPELAELWAKDRAKKAERKRERDLEKLMQAADPLEAKKGGKKGRKLTARLAQMDPTITVIPDRVIDMTTLVQQIRRFLDNIGGPREMTLPPANKETRKMIHELAIAFNLKSVSKGKGDGRYTTLTKTTRSAHGIVNEQKVGKVVRWGRSRGIEFASKEEWTTKGGKMPKHREGDEVGKAAPKLNESNIGFRLLAAMGWEEGDRIGLSGGLKDPLTAVIKHSKLGLGATR